MTYDKRMRRVTGSNLNQTVAWYLMASYAYYTEDDPILTDAAFDGLAKLMLKHWSTIQHRHKGLITEDDLNAGSLLRREFPLIVAGAVADVRKLKGD